MHRSAFKNIGPYLLFMILLFMGCATVPKEVVELSYTVGDDIEAIQSSYKLLVQTYFDGLRTQTLNFLNEKWRPEYLRRYIKEGKLIENVSNNDPDKVLIAVEVWTDIAIETIENKKDSLITPIDNDENNLMIIIDEAFANIIRSNAVITAHLNSIREVKELQDETLSALGVKDLRDKINNALIEASNKSKEMLNELKKAEGITQ